MADAGVDVALLVDRMGRVEQGVQAQAQALQALQTEVKATNRILTRMDSRAEAKWTAQQAAEGQREARAAEARAVTRNAVKSVWSTIRAPLGYFLVIILASVAARLGVPGAPQQAPAQATAIIDTTLSTPVVDTTMSTGVLAAEEEEEAP